MTANRAGAGLAHNTDSAIHFQPPQHNPDETRRVAGSGVLYLKPQHNLPSSTTQTATAQATGSPRDLREPLRVVLVQSSTTYTAVHPSTVVQPHVLRSFFSSLRPRPMSTQQAPPTRRQCRFQRVGANFLADLKTADFPQRPIGSTNRPRYLWKATHNHYNELQSTLDHPGTRTAAPTRKS